MYMVNEVPLDNPARGWRLLRRTQAIAGLTRELSSVSVPGRHGVLPGVPSFRGAPTATFVIRCSGAEVENVVALFDQDGGQGVLRLEDDMTRAAAFELASVDVQGITAFDELVTVTATVRFPSADWRATAPTVVGPTSITTAQTTFELFPGISSDIRDMDIFIGGNFGNFEVRDVTTGAWLKSVGTIPFVSGSGLLYVGATGQAFRATTANPWVPTADLTNLVDVSGGGGLRFTPTVTTPGSSDRVAKVRLTVTNTSGVTFTTRANNAYVMRNGSV